ncbi:hypothetical protein [Tsuneonella sp. HG222]
MTRTRLLIALPLLAVASACVPSTPAPTPIPTPTPRPSPVPTPTPTPAPTHASWMDAPATPGDWTYRTTAGGSAATFGEAASGARFTIACNRAARSVSLTRAASSQVAVPMQVRTETAERAFTAVPGQGGVPELVATITANDSFLDAIAFSRGRFAVEIAGVAPLYIPAWPEIGRVIDDCR